MLIYRLSGCGKWDTGISETAERRLFITKKNGKMGYVPCI
jgi:hypothetical protein